MTDDEHSDKPALNRPERRKKIRRTGKDRRDHMRWELDNPMRRKSPGRRALDHLLYVLDPKR